MSLRSDFEFTPKALEHGEAVVVTVRGHIPRYWDPHLEPVRGDLHRAHIATHLAVEGVEDPSDGDEWVTVDASLPYRYTAVGGFAGQGCARQSWRAADGCIITFYHEARWRRRNGWRQALGRSGR